MGNRILLRSISIVLVIILFMFCMPTAFAEETKDFDRENYMPGRVLIGVRNDAPSVENLVPELEIERIEGTADDPYVDRDYFTYKNTDYVHYYVVTLKELTKDATQKAISLYEKNPYVLTAEPFYLIYRTYVPGHLMLMRDRNAFKDLSTPELYAIPTTDKLLKGIEIEEVRSLMYTSEGVITLFIFKEKSKDIVAEAVSRFNGYEKFYNPEADITYDLNWERRLGQPTEPIKLEKGDVDCDGQLSIIDATFVQKHLARLCDFDETQKELADFDNDGNVTINDVTLIQKTLADI